MLFAYVGPETVMPIASVLAGAVGVVLIAWSWVSRTVGKLLRKFRKKSPIAPRSARGTEATE